MTPIEDAARRNLPNCPKCMAWTGDPCRTPSGKTTKAHKEREVIATRREPSTVDHDHMNAHLHADGTIAYEHPCEEKQ